MGNGKESRTVKKREASLTREKEGMLLVLVPKIALYPSMPLEGLLFIVIAGCMQCRHVGSFNGFHSAFHFIIKRYLSSVGTRYNRHF